MNSNALENKRILKRNRRMWIAGCVFSICYCIIGLKAVYLQVFEEARLTQRASCEYSRSGELREKRGTIYDVNSREMVVSTSVVSIGAHPEQIEKPAAAAQAMADHLDISKRTLMKKLSSDKPFVWITRDAAPGKAEAVAEAIPSGLELSRSFCRIYPNKTLAAQLLGFSGIDGNGLEGLEYYYDEFLKGDVRQWTIVKDALGRIFDKSDPADADYAGKNLILTIDANIQYMAEEALKKSVLTFNANAGMAVVMVPQTGAIRAIAHYPTFNPNAFGQFPKETWRNRAITDPFEPGSTMKVFLAAAALESGQYSPQTVIDCEGGEFAVGGHVVHDTHPYDELTLHEVVKYSSNIGAAKIAEALGPKRLHDTLRAFGFGEKTGIDCPGETTGQLRHFQAWRKIDHATIAFGQGVSVSAIQLLSAISAIANHGMLMKPRIVKAVTNPDGSILESFDPEPVRQAISAETAGRLKAMMHSVTEADGTGPQAVPAGYSVCGKTGTAQVLNANGSYANCDYNALFVGFSPMKDPKLAVLVVVEAPKVNIYGGVVAAPAFAEIVRETFNYMNVPPVVVQTGGNEKAKKADA